MRQRGTFAACLLCVLGIGGIFALFSQAGREVDRSPLRAFDAGTADPAGVDQILPTAIESGLRALQQESPPASRSSELERSRLTLR